MLGELACIEPVAILGVPQQPFTRFGVGFLDGIMTSIDLVKS